MALANIPALVKHVTVAIYWGNSIPGSGEAKFMHALKIARGVLVRDGYLTSESEKGDTAKIRLTSKGQQRNLKHIGDNPAKTREFDKLFEKVEMAVDHPEPDKSEETQVDQGAQRELVHAEKLRAGAKPTKPKKKYVT